MKKLVSVIMPTSKRTITAIRTMKSYATLAGNRKNIEFIFKRDEEDFLSGSFGRSCADLGFQVVLSPKGRGYPDLGRHFSDAAQKARGQWLFFVADDQVMGTPGWDVYVADLKIPAHGLMAAKVRFNNGTPVSLITRTIFALLGHVSPIAHVDSYLNELLSAAGVVPVQVPIETRNCPNWELLVHWSHAQSLLEEELVAAQQLSSFHTDKGIIENYLKKAV